MLLHLVKFVLPLVLIVVKPQMSNLVIDAVSLEMFERSALGQRAYLCSKD